MVGNIIAMMANILCYRYKIMITKIVLFLGVILLLTCCNIQKGKELSASYSTTYQNPMKWADIPDMSITRNGDDYYLISTTMHLMPGAPVMHSKDLVNWGMASYVFEKLEDTPKYDLLQGTVYGRGQWASSIRYYKGKYYVLFSPNDQPYRSYIYESNDPIKGSWKLLSRMKHFHDASLFFDDDGRVYVFSGTGSLRELKEDLSDVKPQGIDMKFFERDDTETGLLEGSQVIKHNGKYYVLMISWPNGKPRRQVVYRADYITGPYEKRVILQDNFADFPYAGQGCIIDDKYGNWYGLIFQDRGAVGRVPLLMPVQWQDNWPMLGDLNNKVPNQGVIPLKTFKPKNDIVQSDDFDSNTLGLQWQWNHNPQNNYWSLKERKGHLRLKTNRIVPNLYLAPNSLTQRMTGPISEGAIKIDLKNMSEGDVSGLSAFNGHSAILEISKENNSKYLIMSTNVVNLSADNKEVISVDRTEHEKIKLATEVIYLKIKGDFNLGKDIATCYYSLDNKNWNKIGVDFKMQFDYKKLFMGSKFMIFNYATKNLGGFVDVDWFNYTKFN